MWIETKQCCSIEYKMGFWNSQNIHIYPKYTYSNVLIAPCSTADPGIHRCCCFDTKQDTKQVQYQNWKTNNAGLVMPVFSLKMAQKLPVCDQFFFFLKLSVCKNFLWFFSDLFDRFWRILSLRPFLA